MVEPPATMRPFLLVLLHRLLNAFPVEAFMVDELVVFGGDNCTLQMYRKFFVRLPLVLELRIWLFLAHLFKTQLHKVGHAWISEAPPSDPTQIPKLEQQNQKHQYGQAALEPAPETTG